jgi:hypothetical protein
VYGYVLNFTSGRTAGTLLPKPVGILNLVHVVDFKPDTILLQSNFTLPRRSHDVHELHCFDPIRISHVLTDAVGFVIDAAFPLRMHGNKPSGHDRDIPRPANPGPIQNGSSSKSILLKEASRRQNDTSGKSPPNNSIS